MREPRRSTSEIRESAPDVPLLAVSAVLEPAAATTPPIVKRFPGGDPGPGSSSRENLLRAQEADDTTDRSTAAPPHGSQVNDRIVFKPRKSFAKLGEWPADTCGKGGFPRMPPSAALEIGRFGKRLEDCERDERSRAAPPGSDDPRGAPAPPRPARGRDAGDRRARRRRGRGMFLARPLAACARRARPHGIARSQAVGRP